MYGILSVRAARPDHVVPRRAQHACDPVLAIRQPIRPPRCADHHDRSRRQNLPKRVGCIAARPNINKHVSVLDAGGCDHAVHLLCSKRKTHWRLIRRQHIRNAEQREDPDPRLQTSPKLPRMTQCFSSRALTTAVQDHDLQKRLVRGRWRWRNP